jgi:hypothetical protein
MNAIEKYRREVAFFKENPGTAIDEAMLGKLVSMDTDAAEAVLLPSKQNPCSVIHRFGPHLYIREVHMPAGTFAIGHHQNFEHLNVFLKGRVLMFGPSGPQEMVAPMMFVGQPGRKKGLIIEDVVWQNIYATDETDIGKLEAMLLSKSESFEAYTPPPADHSADRADFDAMLKDLGVTAELVRQQSENMLDQIPFPSGSYKCRTALSDLHGTGLFATAMILPGEPIAPARVSGMRTPAGRYANHSANPNAVMVVDDRGDVALVAVRIILGCMGGQNGEEITIDYRHARRVSQGELPCQQ